MRFLRFILALVAMVALVHCAVDTSTELEQEKTGSTGSALCAAEWSPTWKQGTGANEWWVEFEIGGGTVASAYLEIPGVRNVQLAPHYAKWAASAGTRITTGTQVILHATTTSGQDAQTVAFGYLAQASPATDPCTSGGGNCFSATFTQQDGANEWWVEYTISGAVASAYLQVVGGQRVTLTSGFGEWRGGPSARIPSGTSVFLHAETASGQIAETQTFRYLVDTNPPAKPCSGGGGTDAGVDSGTPDAGGSTCTFDPTWTQGAGANEWWVEYAISGSIRAASFHVVGGQTITLTAGYGKWRGKPSARVPNGASVFVRAESTTGQIAETNVFRYLVDTAPETKGCTGGGGGTTGLDTRPSNTTCVAPPRPSSGGAPTLTPVYSDLFASTNPARVVSPMIMVQRPGNASRWFLAQRDGRIVSFNAAGDSTTRDLRTVVSASQLSTLTRKPISTAEESGLQSIAFDPNFATNGRLYVFFGTTCDGQVPLCDDPKNLRGDYWPYASEVGYLRSTDGGATFTSYTRLMHMGRSAQFHFGGTVVVGRDGYLYITTGDSLDPGATQYTNNLFGKVLRIDPHGTPAPGKAYAIPPTNPFAGGSGGLPEVFAWGFRNPFRLTVDRLNGDLWLGDVGQDSYEEVNRVQRAGNYGWPCREGAHQMPAYDDTFKCPVRSGFTDPVYEHAHGSVGRSITGGYVYRGAALGGLYGAYVYGDFMQKELRSLTQPNGTWTSTILNANGPQDGYVSFAEDDAGEIYSVALFDHKIHKLVASSGTTSTFPQRLSETGCVVPTDPTRPSSGVIPFAVNAELWSDGAAKERWMGLPNATRITVGADGDFAFPIGTVLMKTFSLAGRRIETRLFVRHSDGEWGGYSYEWNDTQTDALLLPGAKSKTVGTQTWAFPSRSECLLCHQGAAGRALGPEIGQLNGPYTYPSTGRTANQLATLQHIGMFASSIGDPATLPTYPKPFEGSMTSEKARAYLHANCSGCHRPNGGAARSTMDLRYATPFGSTNTCNAPPIVDDFGSATNRLVKPGAASESIVSLRMHTLDARRMPPLASSVVHAQGVSLIDSWIASLGGCP
jgi:uncharacterized repeat protein (TIGR03806 family)